MVPLDSNLGQDFKRQILFFATCAVQIYQMHTNSNCQFEATKYYSNYTHASKKDNIKSCLSKTN